MPKLNPSEKSMHLAAQCWQHETTKNTEMDSDLAMVFADRLDKVQRNTTIKALAVIDATKEKHPHSNHGLLEEVYELIKVSCMPQLGESNGESETKADKPVIKSDRLKDHQQSPFEDTD